MDAQQQIQIFSIAFYICLAIMIAGFGFAIFAFFKYRIPTVFALMTGRVQKKSIEKMMASGQMRSEEEREEDAAHAESRDGADTEDYATEPIAGMSVKGPVASDQQETTLIGEEQETTMLQPEPETSLLREETETTILKNDEETTLLNGNQEAETSVLKRDNVHSAGNAFNNEDVPTEKLSEARQSEQKENQTHSPKGRFEIIEDTIITHTEETI